MQRSLEVLLSPLLIVLAACGGEEPASPAAATNPANPQASRESPVEIVLDGALVTTVTAAELDERRCLPDLLPAEHSDPLGWVVLDVVALDGRRRLPLGRPGRQFHNQDFCLYRSKDGKPSFGVYRRDDPHLHPRIRELRWQPAPFLEGVAIVSIRTIETPEEAAEGTLTVLVDGGRGVPITPEMLAKLRPVESPETGGGSGGGTREDKRPAAWHLRDVLALAVDPDRIEALLFVNVAGERHDLQGAALAADAETKPLLKRNRRGDHHLRLLEGQRVALQFRRVVRIEVRTRSPR